MKQAALSDGFAFDAVPFQHDDVAAPEVDVGGCEVTEALMVAAVVVMIDEAGNLPLEITRQEVVFEQDAVLQRLVPSLDLTLGLGWQGAPRVWSMPLLEIARRRDLTTRMTGRCRTGAAAGGRPWRCGSRTLAAPWSACQ